MAGSYSEIRGVQENLLRDILLNVEKIPDAPVKDIAAGSHLIAVVSDHAGLCGRISGQGREVTEKSLGTVESALELASLLLKPFPESPDSLSCAMAAINSLLPVPDTVLRLKAQELILRNGKEKNVAVIGHFPFTDEIRSEFRNLWVLEIRPRPGDLPAGTATEFLPRADVVAITATTLLNGTCADILRLIRKDAYTIMLGPSTPFAPCLFDWGIDALAGCSVNNAALVVSSIREELPYRRLKGIDPLIWLLEKDPVKT